MELKDKVAVVTGAGRGLGAALAHVLAARGCRVVLAELAITGAEVATAIRDAGGQALFVKTDVADGNSLADMVDQAHAEFGNVDLLINSAIISPVVSVEDMAMEQWDRVQAINLRAPVQLTKLLLGDLRERRGAIVNILSGAAMDASGLGYMSAYCTSKAGLCSFTMSLAQEEHDKGLLATAIWVGMTDTPGARESMAELAPKINARYEDMIAALRPPKQVAEAIVYMLEHNLGEYSGMAVEDSVLLDEAGLTEKLIPEAGQVTVIGTPDQLVQGVLDVITENEQSLGKLPAFIRPLARRKFQSVTGKNFTGWRGLLEQTKTSGQAPAELAQMLPKLKGYVENAPAEVAKFTRDASTLREVSEIASRQAAAIKALQDSIA